MKQAQIIKRIDLKRTLLAIPMNQSVYLPISGFTVNTVRSTAARLNNSGQYGVFSVSEDYNEKRIIVARNN